MIIDVFVQNFTKQALIIVIITNHNFNEVGIALLSDANIMKIKVLKCDTFKFWMIVINKKSDEISRSLTTIILTIVCAQMH